MSQSVPIFRPDNEVIETVQRDKLKSYMRNYRQVCFYVRDLGQYCPIAKKDIHFALEDMNLCDAEKFICKHYVFAGEMVFVKAL